MTFLIITLNAESLTSSKFDWLVSFAKPIKLRATPYAFDVIKRKLPCHETHKYPIRNFVLRENQNNTHSTINLRRRLHYLSMACIDICTIVCVIFLATYAVFSPVKANECRFDHECPSSFSKEYCCDRKYPEDNICKTSCIGETCISNSDCAKNEFCCNGPYHGICGKSCVGKKCTSDYNCATGECCDSDDKCSTDDCVVLAGWIIAVIVISVIVAVVIPIAVVVFCCCCAAAASTRRAHGGIIVTQPTTTGTTVVGAQQQNQYYPMQQGQPMYLQNSQPYPSHPPPAYQPQGMAYPPPGTAYPPTAIPPQIEEARKQ